MNETFTVVLLKPDATERGLVGEILARIWKAQLCVRDIRTVKPTSSLVARHYSEHRDHGHFAELIDYMTRGVVLALLVTGEDAVGRMRELRGPTRPLPGGSGNISNDFCQASPVGENLVHASKSVADARRERSIWFEGWLPVMLPSNEGRSRRAQWGSTLDRVTHCHDILLFGPPGAGKSTFVAHLQRLASVRYISIGDITRTRIEHDNDEQLKQLLLAGGRWSLGTVLGLVDQYIREDSPFILDGVPRYPEEAKWLLGALTLRPWGTIAVELESESSAAQQRLASETRRGRLESSDDFVARKRVFADQHRDVLDILRPAIKQTIRLDSTVRSPTQLVRDFVRALEGGPVRNA